MGPSKLIVGLGNPGPEYVLTRHNIGFWAMDRLSEMYRIPIREKSHHTVMGFGSVRGIRIALAKPQTYMNESGKAVRAILKSEGLRPLDMIVLHDDMDIALGRVKLSTTGGDAGHNGIGSIISSLGTGDFTRLRIGLGRRPEGVDGADWVLTPFVEEELEAVEAAVQEAAERAVEWVFQSEST